MSEPEEVEEGVDGSYDECDDGCGCGDACECSLFCFVEKAGELQHACEHECEVLIEDYGVEVEVGSSMEGDFPVSEYVIVFCHFSGDIFFAEEVHDK